MERVQSMEQPQQGLAADEAKQQLVSHWLLWGVLPVVAFFVISVAVGRFAHHAPLSEVKSEDRFQAFLAIAAGLFLLAFWLDSHLTNPEHLVAASLNPSDGDNPGGGREGRHKLDPEQRAVIRGRVVRIAAWLAFVGIGIGTDALAASWHLPSGKPYYGLQIIAVAVVYQLFVLSRHRAYFDLIDGKTLVMPPSKREDEKGKSDGTSRRARKGKSGRD
jgi:hypothetical protein